MINFKRRIASWFSCKPINLLILAALYALVYDYVYREFVDHYFAMSLKGNYNSLHGIGFLLYVFLASFPFIFYRGLKTIAASFSLFTYILVYIPLLNSLFAYSFSSTIQIGYSMTFFVCMCLFFITDRIYVMKKIFKYNRKLIPFRFIESFTLICVGLLVLFNISQMSFVNFLEDQAQLYEARAENDLKGVYLICWMRGCFLPLIMVNSLRKRNLIKYLIAFVAFIFVFMMDKQKLTAVFPLILTGLYFIINKYNTGFTKYFHSIVILFFIILSFSVVSYISFTDTTFSSNPVLFSLATLFILRTQCIEGMEAERYISFFVEQNNPHTYYGHINIINALTNIYPYSESVGETVAGDGGNANATFWLMDGVAAMGITGVLIISLIFIAFKSIMNSADIRCPVPIYVCISLQGIMAMMNVSLFTSILTSGLLMLFFVLFFVDTSGFTKKIKCHELFH